MISNDYLKELLEFRRGLVGGFQVKQEILGALIIIQDGQVCCLTIGTERGGRKHEGKSCARLGSDSDVNLMGATNLGLASAIISYT